MHCAKTTKHDPGQVLTTFSTIKVVDPIGQDVTPDKVYDLRQQYGYIQN